ncbi:hypothetical protein GJAV_G00121630 [Gymnothorax javanicus]|nr:hypothetical protein GJAV_G00121630 [Gymnothorax javanicus]
MLAVTLRSFKTEPDRLLLCRTINAYIPRVRPHCFPVHATGWTLCEQGFTQHLESYIATLNHIALNFLAKKEYCLL